MKKGKTLVTVVVTLVVGYVAGALVGMPGVDSSLLSGDVSKVSKYNEQISDDAKAFQERLEKDPEFCEQTIATVATVDTRMDEFRTLADSTIAIVSEVKELKASADAMAELNEFANEAHFQADSTLASLVAMLDGKKGAAYHYDRMAKNAVVAYMMIDKQDDVVRNFVADVDRYTSRKDLSKYEKLIDLRNKWVVFSATTTALNNNQADFAYTNKKGFGR